MPTAPRAARQPSPSPVYSRLPTPTPIPSPEPAGLSAIALPPPPSLTVPAVAGLLGVNPTTVLRWISLGIRGERLRAARVGGRWRVDAAEVTRFNEALRVQLVGEDRPRVETRVEEDRRAVAAKARVAEMLG